MHDVLSILLSIMSKSERSPCDDDVVYRRFLFYITPYLYAP